jgi:hypothetical protein
VGRDSGPASWLMAPVSSGLFNKTHYKPPDFDSK